MTGVEGLNGQTNNLVKGDLEIARGIRVPTVQEFFDMEERGHFDPHPDTGTAPAIAQLAFVPEEDLVEWASKEAEHFRKAGDRATWEGRRGVRERTFADREKPEFVGRYVGKAAVTPALLEREYGSSDIDAIPRSA